MPEKKHGLIVGHRHSIKMGRAEPLGVRPLLTPHLQPGSRARGLFQLIRHSPIFPIQAGAPVIQSSHSHPEWAPCPHVSISANTPTDMPGDAHARSLQVQTGWQWRMTIRVLVLMAESDSWWMLMTGSFTDRLLVCLWNTRCHNLDLKCSPGTCVLKVGSSAWWHEKVSLEEVRSRGGCYLRGGYPQKRLCITLVFLPFPATVKWRFFHPRFPARTCCLTEAMANQSWTGISETGRLKKHFLFLSLWSFFFFLQ